VTRITGPPRDVTPGRAGVHKKGVEAPPLRSPEVALRFLGLGYPLPLVPVARRGNPSSVPATYRLGRRQLINTAPEDRTITRSRPAPTTFGRHVLEQQALSLHRARGSQRHRALSGGEPTTSSASRTAPGLGRPVVFEHLIFENGFSSTDGIAGAILMTYAEATFVSHLPQQRGQGRGGRRGLPNGPTS
jgi:hypothetical protein